MRSALHLHARPVPSYRYQIRPAQRRDSFNLQGRIVQTGQHPLFMDLLKRLYWFDNALQSALKKSGFQAVTRAQSLILLNIMVGERRAARLASNLGVSRQAMSQMLAEMEKRGLVTFKADQEDKRAQVVLFSEESHDIRHAAMRILSRLEHELENRIGARNVAALRKALTAEWGPPVIDR